MRSILLHWTERRRGTQAKITQNNECQASFSSFEPVTIPARLYASRTFGGGRGSCNPVDAAPLRTRERQRPDVARTMRRAPALARPGVNNFRERQRRQTSVQLWWA